MVSRRPGFRFWVFFISVWVGYVLGDDHSLMGGSDDAWTWWIVGLFGCPASCCMSCVRAPWTWGLFMCFCALFSPLNVEGVYNEPSPCCNCNSLTSNLPSCTVPLWGGPARSSPLYHFGFGAVTASLPLRRCYLQLESGHAVRAAPRCSRAQRANSDSHFWFQRAIVARSSVLCSRRRMLGGPS